MLGYGGYLVFGGSITVGTLLAFVLYLSNFFDPVQQLSQLYNTFLSAVAALDKIMEVLDEEPEIVDEPGAPRARRGSTATSRFEDVRFGYGRRASRCCTGSRLDVPAGTTVALVGQTGAGKSTIAKLIARFYDPRDGADHDRRRRRPRRRRRRRCAASSESCRRRASCSPAPCATTSPSAGPTRRRTRSRRPRGRSARTTS